MIGHLVLCLLLKLINASEECGKASPDSGQFAVIRDDSVDVIAPWVAAIHWRLEKSSEGFEKFVVTCSGVICQATWSCQQPTALTMVS